MLAHEQRVVDEKTELDKKICSLESFFSNTIFLGLSKIEQDMLVCQFNIMKSYSCVLSSRISLFNKANEA
jgi:hypothetical protein